MAQYLKQRIESLDYCKVLNLNTMGTNVVWWVLPKGRDAKRIFQRMDEGKLAEKSADAIF